MRSAIIYYGNVDVTILSFVRTNELWPQTDTFSLHKMQRLVAEMPIAALNKIVTKMGIIFVMMPSLQAS